MTNIRPQFNQLPKAYVQQINSNLYKNQFDELKKESETKRAEGENYIKAISGAGIVSAIQTFLSSVAKAAKQGGGGEGGEGGEGGQDQDTTENKQKYTKNENRTYEKGNTEIFKRTT
jgi:hypothetical protein